MSAATKREMEVTTRTSRLFSLAFVLYVFVALFLLVLGILPAVAQASAGWERAFADWGRGHNLIAEVSRAVSAATRQSFPAHQLAVDYALSVFNLGLGLLVVRLRPYDRTARLLALGAVGTAAAFNIPSHAILAQLGAPVHPTLFANICGFFHVSLHGISGLAYLHAMLLFPDGRLRPAWARWPLRALYVVMVSPAAIQASFVFAVPSLLGAPIPNSLTYRVLSVADTSWMVLSFGILIPVVGIYSQWSRYRKAPSPRERQQSRLLVWALSLALIAGVAFVTLSVGVHATTILVRRGFAYGGIPQLLFRLFPPLFVVIPLALFIAIVRFRLWDVDRLITRTVVYGSVTALLGFGYVATVFVLDLVFRPVTGRSELAVAVSTLLMAALFRPVRRRIQAVVDRRFNRAHYNAIQTVDAFALRLREETDIDSMTDELRDVVSRTMEPVLVSLWLKEPSR